MTSHLLDFIDFLVNNFLIFVDPPKNISQIVKANLI
jgi:hypothetical protein